MTNRALFLDRDGTITERYHHPSEIAHLRIIDGVPAALRPFQARGWKIIIVTNQHAVALGLLTEAQMHAMNDALVAWLANDDAQIDAVYTCVHAKDAGCTCRKPAPGMLLSAAVDHDVDLARSWMVGDFPSDVMAGVDAGCRTAYVDYGTHSIEIQPTITAASTVEALRTIWNISQ